MLRVLAAAVVAGAVCAQYDGTGGGSAIGKVRVKSTSWEGSSGSRSDGEPQVERESCSYTRVILLLWALIERGCISDLTAAAQYGATAVVVYTSVYVTSSGKSILKDRDKQAVVELGATSTITGW